MITITFTSFNTDPIPSDIGLDPTPTTYSYGSVVGGGTALNTKDGDTSYVDMLYVGGSTRSLITARGVLSTPVPTGESAVEVTTTFQSRYTVDPTAGGPFPFPILFAVCPAISSTVIDFGILYWTDYPWTEGMSWFTEAHSSVGYVYGVGSGQNAHYGQLLLDVIENDGYFILTAGNSTSLEGEPIRVSQLGYSVETAVIPKFETFTEDFSVDLDPENWDDDYDMPPVYFGQVPLSSQGIQTRNFYELKNSYVYFQLDLGSDFDLTQADTGSMWYAEIAKPGLPNGSGEHAYLDAGYNYLNYQGKLDFAVWRYLGNYEEYGQPYVADSDLYEAFVDTYGVDYDPVAHKWLRFRQDNDGYVYLDASHDGVSWVQVYKSYEPVDLSPATFWIYEGNTGSIYVDNINTSTALDKFETLTDTFSRGFLDPELWYASGKGTTGIDAGRLRLDGFASVTSVRNYTLVDSYIYLEAQITGGDTLFFIVAATQEGNVPNANFYVSSTVLDMWWTDDSGATDFLEIPYDPVNHRWLRIRQDLSGVVHFDTANVRGAWVERYASPTVMLLTSAYCRLAQNS